MLKLHETLTNLPLMSLRTGGRIGTATNMIINPNNLKVLGWYVQDRFSSESLVLLSTDVRDISNKGIIINDHEVLSPPAELVRHKKVLEIGYELIGKKVVSENGEKYGKVNDYSVETNGMFIKKFYAQQSLLKSLAGSSRSIDRNQVVEVTNSKIVISDPTEKTALKAPSTAAVN